MGGAGGEGEEVRPHYLHNFYTQLPFTANTEAQRGTHLSRIIKRAGNSPLFPRLQTNMTENGGRGDQDPSLQRPVCQPASFQPRRPLPRPSGFLGVWPPTSCGPGPALPGSANADLELMPIWKSSCCYEAGSFPDQEHVHVKDPGLCNLSQILESRVFIFLKHVRGGQMMPSI